MKEKKAFKLILYEVVFMGIVIGLIPGLTVDAIDAIYGPCHDVTEICTELQMWGVGKAIGVFLCTVVSCVLALIISKEYNQ